MIFSWIVRSSGGWRSLASRRGHRQRRDDLPVLRDQPAGVLHGRRRYDELGEGTTAAVDPAASQPERDSHRRGREDPLPCGRTTPSAPPRSRCQALPRRVHLAVRRVADPSDCAGNACALDERATAHAAMVHREDKAGRRRHRWTYGDVDGRWTAIVMGPTLRVLSQAAELWRGAPACPSLSVDHPRRSMTPIMLGYRGQQLAAGLSPTRSTKTKASLRTAPRVLRPAKRVPAVPFGCRTGLTSVVISMAGTAGAKSGRSLPIVRTY